MASKREEVLLSGEFMLLSKKRTPHKVTLTRYGLFYSLNPTTLSTTYEEKFVQVSDIIGCHSLDPTTSTIINFDDDEESKDFSNEVEPSTPSNIGIPNPLDPSTTGFIIFAYPFRKKVFSGKKVRHRLVLAFALQHSKEVFEERKRQVDIWRNIINCLCRDIPVDKETLSSTVVPPHGRILILINPHSGPGKAATIFKTSVQPMLHEANIPYKAVITEYSGHATAMLKDLQLSKWYGIVIVSGDGLIFETINGIMSRGDWVTSIQTPIGCIPGGSGNALCCSINYAAGEPVTTNPALHSTFILIKHRVLPMDLVVAHIPNQTIYSFLSISWGMLADIDYESEKYRNLGEARFTVGAIRRILGLRSYRGRVSFLPVAEYRQKESDSPGSNKKILSKIRSFSLRSRSSSKSTLNSIDETSSPILLKHRSLSMDQSGYCEAQAYRSDIDYSKEIDKLAGGDKESISDSVFENGVDHENTPEEEIMSISDLVADSPSSSRTSNAADSGQSSYTIEGSSSPSSVHNGNVNINSNSQKNINAKSNDCSVDSVLKEMNGNLNSVPKESAGDSLENNVQPPHAPEYQKAKSDASFTVMAEAQEVKVEQETYTGSKADFAPVPTPLLPPLDQPVPDNWMSLEDDYILVCAVYQTHLGSELLAAPDAHLNDGFIHLMMVKDGISRNTLLNLFLSFGEGGHIHSPYVDYVKVLAFRLEPLTSTGNIMIDGERFDPSVLQAQILPGVAKVMAIR